MSFCSVPFLFHFLPIFIICYFLVPGKLKNLAIIVGSLFLYAWGDPVNLILLISSVFINYIGGIFLDFWESKQSKKIVLTLLLVFNLIILMLGKRFSHQVLPLGVVVYTIQNLSYIFDVYNGECKSQVNIIKYGVFVSIFTHLQAGPVVMYSQLEKQLDERKMDWISVKDGLVRMVIGLAKKILLADQIAELWFNVYSLDLSKASILTMWLGVLASASYIYFTYSAISDIAIGLDKCMGFEIPENFNYPLQATSVTDFCNRWYISVMSWVKKYIYGAEDATNLPKERRIFKIFIVWIVLSVLLIDQKMTFALCGLWLGIFVVLEKLFDKQYEKIPMFFRRVFTIVIMLVGGVIFNCENVKSAFYYMWNMIGFWNHPLADARGLFYGRENFLLILMAGIASVNWLTQRTKSIKKSETGFAIAAFRLGEKIFLAVLLLVSIAYMVSARPM